MTSTRTRWATAVAITSTLLGVCSFLATKFDHDLLFVVAPGFCVVALCVLGEWLFPGATSSRRALLLLAGGGRGGLVGVGAWWAMMFLVTLFQEAGDKLPLVVVYFTPFAFGLGAVVGGVARFVNSSPRENQT